MILTVAEFREHVSTTLSDAALQRLLDAAESEILAYAGDPAGAIELVDGGLQRIPLSRRASSITSVMETRGTTVTTLAGDDYRLRADGYVLERLRTGSHPSSVFRDLVTITYASFDDTAAREAVQIGLVQLDISANPTLRSETIGQYSQTFAVDKPIDRARAELLSRLTPEAQMRVVGVPSRPTTWTGW